ncbi:MAG: D-glycero-beta-D-manno-heptose-7-phosphate kinase [Deltaproteobacteria bacterium]
MENLKKAIGRFGRANILVIGDLILDEYITGTVERISPEAPVPVVWARERQFMPGGAANVASNLRALGARVTLAGVVGKDHNRTTLLNKLKERGIDPAAIVSEEGRMTTVKSRLFARNQQLVRIDWEHVEPINRQTRDTLLSYVRRRLKAFDAVIIEDYGKGLFDHSLLSNLIGEARQRGKIITVDPKEDNFESYYGVTCITPNRKEAENAVRYLKMKDESNSFKIYHDKLASHSDIKKAGYAILGHLGLESLLITLGEHGMWLFEQDKDLHIPTVAQEVFDVSGAGDTAIASFTLALAAGASKSDAAKIANFASGIVVGKLGTATITREELTERMGRNA